MSRATLEDRGVAALELALFMALLFGLLALMAPLGQALVQKNRLERVAGEAARFATQLPDHQRPGTLSRKPTVDDICNDARRAAMDAGLIGSTTDFSLVGCTVSRNGAVVTGTDNTRVSGDQVTVNLTFTSNLGAFGGILNAAGIGPRTISLSATGLARQE
jgi:Flp pilus assembly protein TadG